MSDRLTALHIKCVILGEANVGKTSLNYEILLW